MHRSSSPAVLVLFGVFMALALPASRAFAQQQPQTPSRPAQVRVGDTTLVADTIPKEDHTARNAFAKALILPGWGHFSIGANRRGMVFVALEGTSWFMLTKTLVKLKDAKDTNAGFRGEATDSLNRLIASDTAIARILSADGAFDEAVDADPRVSRSRGLVNARSEQRQDWITYTLFFTMASAVDAYVAANLRDFPVGMTALPGRDGSVSFRFSMPFGNTPGRLHR